MTDAWEDKRVRGPAPVKAPGDLALVTRERAAEIAGVTVRTWTRWAGRGLVTKYLDPRLRVRFSSQEARRMKDVAGPETADATGVKDPEPEPVTVSLPRPRGRW